MGINDPEQNIHLALLIERSRDLAIDLAAAKERELAIRFDSRINRLNLRRLVIRIIKKFPVLYRFALKIKNR
jgi:hypothetical protein